jgi:hypothetical protein
MKCVQALDVDVAIWLGGRTRGQPGPQIDAIEARRRSADRPEHRGGDVDQAHRKVDRPTGGATGGPDDERDPGRRVVEQHAVHHLAVRP